MAGPLAGVRVLELTGIGPGPFGGMLLADLGADVIVVDRPAARASAVLSSTGGPLDPLARGRRSVGLDITKAEGVAAVRRLATTVDVLLDPFRPGVLERRGLGPDDLRAADPRLIYARITGWGQDGPWATHAGHDINYIALVGALHGIGRRERPTPPVNYLGDFAGGAMFLAFGIVAALFERERSGEGQVIDVAMVDGTAVLTGFLRGFQAKGMWRDERESNFIDGAAHNYDVYETADGRFVSIGTLEPPFYARLLEVLGVADDERFRVDTLDPGAWSDLKLRFADIFRTRTRDDWSALLEGETEMCFAPVLTLDEATTHHHLRARATFVDVGGQVQPAPAPRFSRTVPTVPTPGRVRGADTDEVLREAGFDDADLAALHAAGAIV